jgi:hypothetical protein
LGGPRLITNRVELIIKVTVFAGEDETEALTLGALRILSGEENPKEYYDFSLDNPHKLLVPMLLLF